MKKEEQTVYPQAKSTRKTANAPQKKREAGQRAAELPGQEASVAAEMKNRENKPADYESSKNS